MDIQETNRGVIEQYGQAARRRLGPQRHPPAHYQGDQDGPAPVHARDVHRDGERLLVIASNIAAAKHPDWYRNCGRRPAFGCPQRDETSVPACLPRTAEWGTMRSVLQEHLRRRQRHWAGGTRTNAYKDSQWSVPLTV
jgi:hypothetical protein